MDSDRLHRRSDAGPPCGFVDLDLAEVGRAILPHHKIAFAGESETWGGPTATIVSSLGDMLPGILYETDPVQESSLSCFENADGHRLQDTHRKISITVMCDDGSAYPSYTFVRAKPEASLPPSKKYVAALEKSYADMVNEHKVGLLREYIKELISEKDKP